MKKYKGTELEVKMGRKGRTGGMVVIGAALRSLKLRYKGWVGKKIKDE